MSGCFDREERHGHDHRDYDKPMADALKATGIKTKREVVELELKTMLKLKQQTELRKLRGKYEWEDDLDAMRRDK